MFESLDNFYSLNRILQDEFYPEGKPFVKIFQTFFFSSIFKAGPDPHNFSLDKVLAVYPDFFVPQGMQHRKIFEDKFYELERKRISRIARKENIFDKKVLIIPVNEEKHWTLIIIENPRCIFEPYRGERALFLYFDSYKDPLYKALGSVYNLLVL